MVVNAIDEPVYFGKLSPGGGTGGSGGTGVGGAGAAAGSGGSTTGGAAGGAPIHMPTDPDDDAGCGCVAPGHRPVGARWIALLVIALRWARRRKSALTR